MRTAAPATATIAAMNPVREFLSTGRPSSPE
jgi:hypothetical protein